MNRFLSITLIALLFLMAGATGSSAQTVRTCASNEYLLQQLAAHPEMAVARQNLENFTQQFVQDQANGSNKTTNAIYNIPVVVHVLYNDAASNISAAQIQSQIDVLNQDFQMLNADVSSTPAAFSSTVADCQIQFCMAQRDPQGNPTTGIVRVSTTTSSFSTNDNAKHTSTGGDDAWPAAQYLNIWVVPALNNGVLGYAQFPGGPASTDGLVIANTCFGNTGTASAPFDKGRTATHEIGHWMNLYHIWGDDGNACTQSDLVGDTPNQADENYNCPTFPTVSCSNGPNGDMFMNYMDYTDDACMFMFTNGQKTRMHAVFAAGGDRNSITTSLGCVPPGAVCNAPSGLNATSITAATATVNWGAVSGATGYNLQWKATSSSTWNTVSNIAGTSSPLTGLSASTSYDYKVQTICSATSSSAYSSVSTFTTSAAAACATPTGLNVTNITGTSATLNWLASPGAASYSLQWRISTTTTWTLVNNINSTSYNLSSLTPNATYQFRVRTKCGSSYTAYTAISSFFTGCVNPVAKAATLITSTTADANWNAAAGSTGYNVQYKTAASATWTTLTNLSGTSVGLSSLTPSTAYNYQVQNICSGGVLSAFSSVINFTTSAATSGCGKPTNPSAVPTSNSVLISWTAVSGAVSYTLQRRLNGTTTWTTLSGIPTNSYNITGLAASTSYQYRIRTACGGGVFSAYTAIGNFTTLSAGCTDNYETNNTKATAKYIPTNTDISGKIGVAGDLDWFKFGNSVAQPNISISLTTLPFDYDVYLYRGTTLLSTGYNAGTSSELVNYNTSIVDTYYVRVEGYNGATSSTLCYTLRAQISNVAFREMAASITSKDNKATIVLYPNPATNEVNLDYNSDMEQDATISIIDQAGRLAMNKPVHLEEGLNSTRLDVSVLPAGFYFVRLVTGDGNITAKLIIQK
jgi:hypothetical protein